MNDYTPTTAFVFGGGGVRGAVEVGMLKALLERGVYPDLVVGTSVGAMNAAALAQNPTLEVIDTLIEAWSSPEAAAIYGEGIFSQAGRALRTHTHLNSPEPIRQLAKKILNGDVSFEDLAVPLQVVAASIERASEHVFASGPVIPALLASTAVPGLFPPAQVGDEHFIDGGMVNSIPLSPAINAGAKEIYVMQVGRIEEPLDVPRTPVDTARVAFEISRRHRFFEDLEDCPEGVEIFVLPSGGRLKKDHGPMAYKDVAQARARIDRAYRASAVYLAEHSEHSRRTAGYDT
ncbi:MAG: patatin-like phospholipase family protein [Ancrocorticia populi]|uniref:patatin-like phospholipase family protein n=1 Tax=Ancrocorticia populi TaxID=2175228 RepID=UPI003F90D315